MILHTCSETISFAKELENKSAKFYEELSQKYAKDKDVFLSFARENGKYVVQIERAYYGVITDAIEGCFAFAVNPDEYTFETELAEKASYSGTGCLQIGFSNIKSSMISICRCAEHGNSQNQNCSHYLGECKSTRLFGSF